MLFAIFFNAIYDIVLVKVILAGQISDMLTSKSELTKNLPFFNLTDDAG